MTEPTVKVKTSKVVLTMSEADARALFRTLNTAQQSFASMLDVACQHPASKLGDFKPRVVDSPALAALRKQFG